MKKLLAAYRLWKTRKELYALSDHMLRDIGLRREQLASAFLEAQIETPRASGASLPRATSCASRRTCLSGARTHFG